MEEPETSATTLSLHCQSAFVVLGEARSKPFCGNLFGFLSKRILKVCKFED